MPGGGFYDSTMSYFESVSVKLACERCGTVHETVVRFRSFSGRPDGEYELMEEAPQGNGLRTGEVWEGNGDRYCPSCSQKWAEAQSYAAYDALAELIEKGLVEVRAEGSATPLTPAEINDYAEEYASDCRAEGVFPETQPYFSELDLTVGGKPYHPDAMLDSDDESTWIASDEIWSEFLNLIDPLIRERMSKDGWIADERTWEDFKVSLDDKRRVVVEDMQGKRLTRDGARIPQ